MDDSKMLRQARDLIANGDHLARHIYRDPTDCYCAFGAIIKAAGHDPMSGSSTWMRPWSVQDTPARLCSALIDANPLLRDDREMRGDPFEVITKWNDAPSTTKESVIEAFDRAIAMLEAAA